MSQTASPFARLLRAAAIAATIAGLAPTVHAGSFSANPVRLSLPAGATSTSVLLENKGDQPVTIQASTASWTQEGGKDVLTATQDLVVSPPIFKIAPGATQTVRVGLLRAPDQTRELTYRLYLQEVPPPPEPGQQAVSVALQLALPVFVQPPGPTRAAPKLVWAAKPADGDAMELSLANEGTAHVQLVDAKLAAEDGTVLAELTPRAYVLPGQAQTWRVKPVRSWGGESLRVVARTSGGDVTGRVGGR